MSDPGGETLFVLNNYRVKSGDVLPTYLVPVGKLSGRSLIVLTVDVDDPTSSPPTIASLGGGLEASDDGGKTWNVIATLWAGLSGTYQTRVVISNRLLRAGAWAEMSSIISLTVEVW